VQAAIPGQAALVLFTPDEGNSQGVAFNLAHDTLPRSTVFIPQTDLGTGYRRDIADLTVSPAGDVAWAVTDDIDSNESHVFLLSPGEPIALLTTMGRGPTFFGDQLLWLVVDASHRNVAGLNLETLESFTVANSDTVKAWTWQVFGSGRFLVLPIKGPRATTTLRVFDVSHT
jgi:hypothetical protein